MFFSILSVFDNQISPQENCCPTFMALKMFPSTMNMFQIVPIFCPFLFVTLKSWLLWVCYVLLRLISTVTTGTVFCLLPSCVVMNSSMFRVETNYAVRNSIFCVMHPSYDKVSQDKMLFVRTIKFQQWTCYHETLCPTFYVESENQSSSCLLLYLVHAVGDLELYNVWMVADVHVNILKNIIFFSPKLSFIFPPCVLVLQIWNNEKMLLTLITDWLKCKLIRII